MAQQAAAATPAHLRVLIGHASRETVKAFNANKTSWVGLWLFLLIALLAVLAPWIAPHDPLEQNILLRLRPPSAEHWFGTDYYGRDTLSRLLWGARISLVIGLLAIGIAMAIGSLIGAGRRLSRRAARHRGHAGDGHPARLPLVDPRADHRRHARPLDHQPGDRDRVDHDPAVRADRARAHHRGQGARVHRGRPRARLFRRPADVPPHPPQHPARDPGDGLALARDRDPGRGLARLHRARASARRPRPGAG